MKKILMKMVMIGSLLVAGVSMTGCTDFERGLATGAAVGVGTAVIANESSRPSYRRSYYNRGYNNGCRSARGRWSKNRYYFNNYASYRNGWRAGWRRCR